MSAPTAPLAKWELAFEFVRNLGMTSRELSRLQDRLAVYWPSLSKGAEAKGFGGNKVNFSRTEKVTKGKD